MEGSTINMDQLCQQSPHDLQGNDRREVPYSNQHEKADKQKKKAQKMTKSKKCIIQLINRKACETRPSQRGQGKRLCEQESEEIS